MNATCPKCLDAAAVVRLDVNDGDTLTCGGCEEEYSAADVLRMAAGWVKLAGWIEVHPARTPEPTVTT